MPQSNVLVDRLSVQHLSEATSRVIRGFKCHPILASLTAVGTISVLQSLYRLSSFTWLHFLRPSKIGRYTGTQANPAWAIVTGSSDGIGRGFAEELLHRGFNVILHGRNEKKLNGVRDDLLKQWPNRQIRILILDAANSADDSAAFSSAIASCGLKDLNLKVLVNNVGGDGGTGRMFATLQERSTEEIGKLFNVNARFATEFTRAVLPYLSNRQPALIVNIGAGASEMAIPYLGIYCGTKAYMKAWSNSLRAEMRLLGRDIDVIHIMVGTVATNAVSGKPGGFTASARGMAQSSLGAVGCGRPWLYPFWPHDLQFKIMEYLPDSVVESFVKKGIEEERRKLEGKA